MSQFPPRELLEPQWFIPFFALMWFVIGGGLALLSGWWSLASRFRAVGAVAGKRLRLVSGSMGVRFLPVNYGNCLFVTVNDKGFRLGILFLFRFLSPPLFIPWERVESVVEKRFLFMRYAAVRIRETGPISRSTARPGRAYWKAMQARRQARERSNRVVDRRLPLHAARAGCRAR